MAAVDEFTKLLPQEWEKYTDIFNRVQDTVMKSMANEAKAMRY